MLVVPEDSPIRKPEDLEGKRIATEGIGITQRYLDSKGIRAEVEFSWGATEVKVPDLVDAIVDITETGSSIKANHLRIVDTLLVSFPTSMPIPPPPRTRGSARKWTASPCSSRPPSKRAAKWA